MKTVQLVSVDDYHSTIIETIKSIKEAGFDSVFLQWYDGEWKNYNVSLKNQVDISRELGLKIEFAHLGYKYINNLWLENEWGEKIVEYYKDRLRELHYNKIDLAVMHLTRGDDSPKYNELGIKRLKQICDYAQKLGIRIAFENTRKAGYLEYVLDNIKNKNVGVCFDSGHFHCYFKDNFNFKKFKNKIFCVHLHDNHGTKDEHLLPFDGNLDWNCVIDGLKQANYNGPIILETGYSEKYREMGINDFYKLSQERAKQIGKMLIKQNTNENGDCYEK